MPKYFFDIDDGTDLHPKNREAVSPDDAEAVRYAESVAEGLRDDDAFAGCAVPMVKTKFRETKHGSTAERRPAACGRTRREFSDLPFLHSP